MQREFLLWLPIIITLAVVVTISKFFDGKTAQMQIGHDGQDDEIENEQ